MPKDELMELVLKGVRRTNKRDAGRKKDKIRKTKSVRSQAIQRQNVQRWRLMGDVHLFCLKAQAKDRREKEPKEGNRALLAPRGHHSSKVNYFEWGSLLQIIRASILHLRNFFSWIFWSSNTDCASCLNSSPSSSSSCLVQCTWGGGALKELEIAYLQLVTLAAQLGLEILPQRLSYFSNQYF